MPTQKTLSKPLHIGIDANEANQDIRVGVGQYAYNILKELEKLDHHNHYYIYLKSLPKKDFPKARQNWNYLVFGPQKLWTKIALPLKLFSQKQKLSFFYTPAHYSPHFSPFPTIPTIHDLGYLHTQEQFTKKDIHQLVHWTKRSLDQATHIATVSQFSKNELKRIYHIPDEKISLVYNGIDTNIKINTKGIPKTLKKFKITKPYFLYLGTLKPNKNIPLILKAFKDFLKTDQSHQLVIAGKKGWLFDEIFQTTKDLKLKDQVIFTDYISEEEKWQLYSKATCSLLPSTYEGFGIPALESMLVNTPIIASNIPPLKEVIQEKGLFINPHKKEELTNAMHQMVKNRQKYQKGLIAQAKKFTWKNSAKQLMDIFSTFH